MARYQDRADGKGTEDFCYWNLGDGYKGINLLV